MSRSIPKIEQANRKFLEAYIILLTWKHKKVNYNVMHVKE